MKYDAFISYSHAKDRDLAARLQSALTRFAKPWYRPRAMRIFRDATSLSANPGLWTAIEGALAESRCFILFASPLSAASEWVQREIRWWLDNRSTNDLYIVLTHGNLLWHRKQRDFDWSVTTGVPRLLSGKFNEEPLYVDLSWCRTPDEQSIRHSRFRAAVLDLAAPLRGIAKDELDSEEIRQNRRVRFLTATAITLLVLLAVGATVAAFIAYHQQQLAVAERVRADHQRDIAKARELAAQAKLADTKHRPERALLLAAKAAEARTPTEPYTEQVLRDLLATIGGLPFARAPDQQSEKKSTANSDDERRGRVHWASTDRWLLSDAGDGNLALWDVARIASDWQPIRLQTGVKIYRDRTAFSPDGSWLVVAGSPYSDRKSILFDLSGQDAGVGRFEIAGEAHSVLFSGDSRRLLLAGDQNMLAADQKRWQICNLDRKRQPVTHALPVPHKFRLTGPARFSPDSRWLIAGQRSIIVWNLEDADYRPTVIGNIKPGRIAFAPDSQGFILNGSLGEPILFQLPPDQEQPKILAEKPTRHVVFSPDAKWLFAEPNLWRLANGKVDSRPLKLAVGAGKSDSRSHWRFLSDGDWLVHEAKYRKLWQLSRPVNAKPTMDLVAPSEIGPRSRWLLVRPPDSPARLIDLHSVNSTDLPGPPVVAASFALDGGSLAVVHRDGVVATRSLLEADSFRRIARVASGMAIRHSPGGAWVLVDDHLISTSRTEIDPIEIDLKRHRDAEFSNDDWLVVKRGSGELVRYDLRSRAPDMSRAVLRGHDQDIAYLRFLNDGNWLLTTSRIRNDQAQARLWDLRRASSAAFPAILRSRSGTALAGRFGPRGRWFVAHCQGRTLAAWPLNRARLPAVTFQAKKNLTGAPRFDQSGRWSAVSGANGNTYLIDLRTDSPQIHQVDCAAPQFSPDSRWVALTRRGESCIRELDGLRELELVAPEGIIESQFFAANGDLIVVRRIPTQGARRGQSYVAYRYKLYNEPPQPEKLLNSPENPEVDATGRWLTAGDGQVVNLDNGRRFILKSVPHPATYRDVHKDHDSTVRIEVSPDGRWGAPLRWVREGYPEFTPRFYHTWQALYDLESADPTRPVFSLSEPLDVKFAGFGTGSRGWVVIDSGDAIKRLSLRAGHPSGSLVELGRIEGERVRISPDDSWLISTGKNRVYLTPIGEERAVSASLPDYKPPGFDLLNYQFSADDALLATQSEGVVQIWRTDLPPDRRWPVALTGRILDISPDNQWLATTHRAGVALHPADIKVLVNAARRVAGRELTETEKSEFLRR